MQITGYNELYSDYKNSSIPKVSEETVLQQQQEEAKRIPESVVTQADTNRVNNASLEDISLTLKVEDFNLVGKDSGLETLDMQKALSDLKKDQVLQEYNYFVGSALDSNLMNASDDGMVFQKL